MSIHINDIETLLAAYSKALAAGSVKGSGNVVPDIVRALVALIEEKTSGKPVPSTLPAAVTPVAPPAPPAPVDPLKIIDDTFFAADLPQERAKAIVDGAQAIIAKQEAAAKLDAITADTGPDTTVYIGRNGEERTVTRDEAADAIKQMITEAVPGAETAFVDEALGTNGAPAPEAPAETSAETEAPAEPKKPAARKSTAKKA